MLLISLTRESRRGINTDTIQASAVTVLRNLGVPDPEKRVSVTFELGRKNSVSVVQTAPISGRWFEQGVAGYNAWKSAVIAAVNSGLSVSLPKQAFIFTINKSGQAEVPVPRVVDQGRDRREARDRATHHGPSAK